MMLHGPFSFDPASPQSSARVALATFARSAADRSWRPPEPPALRPPGLYFLLGEDQGQVTLEGFWLVFGAWYLQSGPQGAPDRVPPYVAALLEAATEAVWWRDLRVAPRQGGNWRPSVVLEWPPALAVRSAFPPPGVTSPGAAFEEAEGDEGHWLVPNGQKRPTTAVRVEETGVVDPVPRERSLLCVVRAEMRYGSSSHDGQFTLLGPERFSGIPPVAPEVWLEVGTAGKAPPPPERHVLGPALALPHGGAGYPLSGWLTRSLELWPGRPADVGRGALARRDVRSIRATQAQLAFLLTVLVFAPTLALALVVRELSRPRDAAAQVGERPDPQPAISVCSPDHQKFVDELRCQIGHLAAGSHPESSVCGDFDSTDSTIFDDDLAPELCGILDRARDGRALHVSRARHTYDLDAVAFVASQACFNVLGHPEPYEIPREEGDPPRRLASPTAFLDDPALGIRSLQDIVDDLSRVCDGYRGRLEARVEGSIFATHVGLAEPRAGRSEPNALREALVASAVSDASERDARCFRAGVTEGLYFSRWPDVCGSPETGAPASGEPPAIASDIWDDLAAPDPSTSVPRGDLVDRYVRARFGGEGVTAQSPDLWACHLDLTRMAEPTLFATNWDLVARVPHAYDVAAGAVRQQLELDALLPLLRGGASAGTCWSVVSERLSRVLPVHPLGSPTDEGDAWSPEQQVCGRVCAAAYGFIPSEGWITRETDLATCVDHRVGGTPDAGEGRLDRLVIPWYGEPATREPATADVCAFNLVAQGLLPEREGGLLVGAADRVAWAGETRPGSRIAGGEDGAATTAAHNLSSYGQSRSRESCANVATQCFVSLLVDTAADKGVERYRWPSAWAVRVGQVPQAAREDDPGLSPWCALIAPHLSPSGTLPDGQFDYPCAKGVEESRASVAETVDLLARGVVADRGTP